MTMSNCNDIGVSESSDCEGQSAYNNRPQSRFRNRPCSSIHPDFDLKTPRTHLAVHGGKFSTPYKFKMCLLFRRGKCFYGENCHFSHSLTGVRKPGFNPVGPKMKECHWFSSGVDCPYGNRCQFLHKCDEKIRKDVDLHRQNSGVDAVSGGIERSGKNWIEFRGMTAGEDNDKMVRGKSQPRCSEWERFGSCPYGVKCIYAHGRKELQDLIFQLDMEHNASKSSKPISAACAFGTTTSMNWQLKAKKCFTECNIGIVSEVYADWIDEEQNICASLCKVGK